MKLFKKKLYDHKKCEMPKALMIPEKLFYAIYEDKKALSDKIKNSNTISEDIENILNELGVEHSNGNKIAMLRFSISIQVESEIKGMLRLLK